MVILEWKSIEKVSGKYYCEKCDYTTSVKSNYKKAFNTAKHKNDNNDNKMITQKYQKNLFANFVLEVFA